MKDDTLYLIHMYERATQVHQKLHGLTRAAFDADENLQLAVVHLLQVIGEAALIRRGKRGYHVTDLPPPACVFAKPPRSA